MTERSDHAKRVCLAVLHVMEKREDRSFTPCEWADEIERNLEAVDLTFESGTAPYALELTRIESFPGQIEHYFQTQEWVAALLAELKGLLPGPGHYVLSFEAGAVRGFEPDPKSLKALVEWVRLRAGGLELGSVDTAPRHFVQEQPHGVPFKVALFRWPARGTHVDGELSFSDFVPGDLEGRRRLRIRQALEAKLPKLGSMSRAGATSILVLESDDIALANAWSVASAFVAELERLQDAIPDRVWLVGTDGEPWDLWELKRDSQVFGPNWRNGHEQIDSAVREELLLKWSLRFGQRSWARFASWEARETQQSELDYGRALAWMWEAWQMARAHDPAWGRDSIDDGHVQQIRKTREALGRLSFPK